jgi:drug/metabolite transporter (DMT)-like permease
MTPTPRGAAATAALTALALLAFAANSVLCRLALRGGEIGPLTFTALRLCSGALVLLPFLRARGEPERWSARAALALALYALGFSLAYLWLDAGVGALLLFGAVQCTMLGAGLAGGERPTPLRALGIALACAGLVVLVRPGSAAPAPAGALLMLAAGVAWGAYSLAGRGARVPTRATARNFLLAAPLGLAAWACVPEAQASARGVALAVLSGALTSGLGYVLWYAALRGHSAVSAAVVQLLVPLLAAAAGVLALGESASPRLFAAAALSLGGVALAVLAPRRGRAA